MANVYAQIADLAHQRANLVDEEDAGVCRQPGGQGDLFYKTP